MKRNHLKAVSLLVGVILLIMPFTTTALAWTHYFNCELHSTTTTLQSRTVKLVVDGKNCTRTDTRYQVVEECNYMGGSSYRGTWYTSWVLGPVHCMI